MQNGIHFISGLPRAGSTLLGALLRQNPALHASITSPVGSLVGAVLRDMCQENETSIFIDGAQRRALLAGLFDSYYHAIHPTKTVFDTNRGWTGRIDLLAHLFPECRVICCVRHVPVDHRFNRAPHASQHVRTVEDLLVRDGGHRILARRRD